MGGARPAVVSGDKSQWLEQDYGGGEASSPLVGRPSAEPPQQGPAGFSHQPWSPPAYRPGQPVGPPAGTRVVVSRRTDALEIGIPPVGLTFGTGFVLLFAILWNGIVWSSELRALFSRRGEGWIALFLLLFIAAGQWLIWMVVCALAMHTRVFIGPATYSVEFILGTKIVQTRGGRTSNITKVRVNTVVGAQPDERDQAPQTSTQCEILEGHDVHKFGEQLRWSENDWLAYEVSSFLQSLRQGAAPPHMPAPAGGMAQWEDPLRGGNKAPIPDHWAESPAR